MPKGRLEREKWLSEGIDSQDLRGGIVSDLEVMCEYDNVVDRRLGKIEERVGKILSIEYL